MRVLITGANGMLATNIIEVLLEKGYDVRGVLRRRSSYKGIDHPRLELCETLSLADCDYVIHSAAITSQSLLRYEDYARFNVDATKELIRLSEVNHVKKFLYVSSANTIGCGTHDAPSNENTALTAPLSRSLYGRSKAEAERIVLANNFMESVVVNPTFMIGRYGNGNGSNKILKMARRVTFCPSGGKNFIDVQEAARGVVAALERGKSGERYLIAGENMLYKDFFRLFAHVRYIIGIPRWVLLVAGLGGSVCRSVGIKTAVSITNMRILSLPVAYDNTKARTDLGFFPRSLSL